MHRSIRAFLNFFICCASASVSLSQSIIRLPFNKKISIADGLSSYNIKKIIQDKYGFIWIATQDGLNRYDGKSFIVYNNTASVTHQLIDIDVWDIEEDSLRDMLWVSTSYGGLNGIDLKTGEVSQTLRSENIQGLNSNLIRCICLYKDDLWIGGNNGLSVYNVISKTIEQFDPIPFTRKAGYDFCIDKIFTDHYRNTWVFVANYGVVVYSADKRKVIKHYTSPQIQLEYKATLRQFKSVIALNNNTFFVATDQGIRRFACNKEGIINVSKGLFYNDTEFDHRAIVALNKDADKYLWFSSASKLYKADVKAGIVHEVKDAYTNMQGDWLNYADAIFFDNNSNICLGTSRGITYTRNRNPAFIPYNVSDDQTARIDHAFYVYPLNDSIVYAGTETGLLKINVYKNEIVTVDKGKPYYFITENVDKKLLVSTDKGFFIYDPVRNAIKKISEFYKELKPLDSISVNSIVYSSDSLAIIGTESSEGIYVWNYKRGILHSVTTDGTKIVNTCYEDRKKRVWVLGDDVINIYDPAIDTIKSFTLENPVTNSNYHIFFDICEARGYYWIATYGTGVIQLDHNFKIKKIYSTIAGLSNAGVYKIFPLYDSLLFISSNNGLSVFHLNTGLFSNYYQEDGLHSNSFEEIVASIKTEKFMPAA